MVVSPPAPQVLLNERAKNLALNEKYKRIQQGNGCWKHTWATLVTCVGASCRVINKIKIKSEVATESIQNYIRLLRMMHFYEQKKKKEMRWKKFLKITKRVVATKT